jgi:hypothetical protein
MPNTTRSCAVMWKVPAVSPAWGSLVVSLMGHLAPLGC